MAMKDPEHYILAIDQGTSTTRAMLFDHQGRKAIESQREFPQYYPHPGWVEQDANEIWNSVQSVITTALINAGIHPEQIDGIGISSQRETTVIWDKVTGNPIYHAIGWQSRQTAQIAKKMVQDGYEDMIHEKTGLVIDSYFSATKVRWLLDHVTGAQVRAENGQLMMGNIDSWLVWKLSDGQLHITDYTNASRTMMFNINTLNWDDDILKLLSIPRQILPGIHSCSEVYGTTKNYQFYGVSVPICGLIGDQQASLIGQTAFEPGDVKNTYGDGTFIMMNTGETPQISEKNLLTTIAYDWHGHLKYALEGSIFVAGTAINWLHECMQIIDSVPQSREIAMQSTNDDTVYVVPAFNGLGAPYWDPDARGAVFGLTQETNRSDFVKATLQSIAYQTKDVVDTMRMESGMSIKEVLADGGASRNRYLMQFQTDILDVPIVRSSEEETTALGAAFCAGLAIGFWKDVDEIKSIRSSGRRFEPNMTDNIRKKLYHGWQVAVKSTQSFKV